jgi:hypothetical protein
VARFEAQDLTSIIELENSLRCVRLAHALMSDRFSLDRYESLVDEVNASTSLVSFHNRIVLHVISQLVLDAAPNYAYCTDTSRFVRAPVSQSLSLSLSLSLARARSLSLSLALSLSLSLSPDIMRT